MFGYVIVNEKDLSAGEKERYRQVYCGLCRELGRRSGQLSRLALNYDMTFLILFLSSLYEPHSEQSKFHCPMHPFRKHTCVRNCYTEYAADMTIALAYYKGLDDWKDDHKLRGRLYAGILQKAYDEVKTRWPRQCGAIENCMEELTQIERKSGNPDQATGCFGRLMAEMFVYEQDFWANSLWQFGDCLGRFIYTMDAAMDYEEDQKSGNYNPIIVAGKKPEEIGAVLTIQIGTAAEIFEKLPMVEDANILRSVIYAGVWQKYRAKMGKTEETEKPDRAGRMEKKERTGKTGKTDKAEMTEEAEEMEKEERIGKTDKAKMAEEPEMTEEAEKEGRHDTGPI